MQFPPEVLRLLELMEAHEDWTLSDAAWQEAVGRLTRRTAASGLPATGGLPMDVFDDILLVNAYTPAGDAISMTAAIGAGHPAFGDWLLEDAALHLRDGDELYPESRVTIDRMLLLARLACFERVFGEDRRRMLIQLIEGVR